MRIETTILKSLIYNDQFGRKVLPFLKEEYFSGVEQKVYKHINDFYIKYNTPPSLEALSVEVHQSKDFDEKGIIAATETIKGIRAAKDEPFKEEWLINTTEKFCQEKALFNAISKSILIMDGKDSKNEKGAIPNILTEALAVCFDPDIGHDFLEDSGERYEYYHSDTGHIPCDLEMLNRITNGGVKPKTLNIVMAGTGIGKTIFMCHLAAAYLAAGLSVLYITLEMAEEEIGKRIDANLLDLNIDDLLVLPKADYERRVGKLKERVKSGKLIIKEFPTAGASALHFENTINELALKKNFKPAIIMVDYLNICLSSRLKSGTTGMYQYVKSIGEEMRGLGQKFKVPVWSATQLNRTGFMDSDPDLDSTSESFGLPMTADLQIVLIASEQLASLQQIMVKQLKNRYRDENKDKRFVLGLDKDRMRFSDVTDPQEKKAGQQEIVRSETGEREELPWEEYKQRKEQLTNKTSKFQY